MVESEHFLISEDKTSITPPNCDGSKIFGIILECSICKSKNNELTAKIKKGKIIASDPKRFFNELESNKEEKKFDIFAKYLGKGIFFIETINNESKYTTKRKKKLYITQKMKIKIFILIIKIISVLIQIKK